MQGVILAAGKGTRLTPLTPARSKAMAPVAGKPLLGRVVDALTGVGVESLVIVAAEDDRDLHRYVQDVVARALPVEVVVQPARLGMAHALCLAAPHLHRDFVMSACDNLVPSAHITALVEAHRTRRASATLSLMPVTREQVRKTGIVEWDDPWVRRIVEKPEPDAAPSTISSLPLYVFSPAILPLAAQVAPSPRGEYELQDAIQALIDEADRVTGVFTETRRQVTDLADLLALNLAYLDEQGDAAIADTAVIAPDAAISPPVRIDAGVTVGAGAVVGPRVYIEAGAQIGPRAQLSDALVLHNAVIAPCAQAHGRIVLAG